jgi:predicted dehydrogenase
MTALVIGYGSIGRRHARILTELGHRVVVVSSQKIEYSLQYQTITRAIEIEQPQYIIIANNTSKHYETLVELVQLDYNGVLLVEKPLFHEPLDLPKNRFQGVYVAYNLRFHPLLQRLYSFLKQQRVITVHTYVGQYLPYWRPQSDYRLCYSAHRSDGGGVLRDLSHELDYITWMLGGWKSVVAMGGKYSQLEIDSDDAFSMMLTTPLCPVVSIHVNYLDRIARRQIVINTNEHTVELDLINGHLIIDQIVEECKIDCDYTYRIQHQNILEGKTSSTCLWEQGLDILRLIQAAEKSAICKRWVSND